MGRDDFLVSVNGALELYRSEGTLPAPLVPTGIPSGTGNWVVTDKDGDGLQDLVFESSAASGALYFGTHNGPGVHPISQPRSRTASEIR